MFGLNLLLKSSGQKNILSVKERKKERAKKKGEESKGDIAVKVVTLLA